MLRTLEDLKRMAIGAADGEIGKVKDAYFDDQGWTVRYLVVETGGWLGRKVLVSPLAISGVDWNEQRIDVHMTREQVKNSPDIDTDKPVSRQHEMLYLNYYGLPYYWGGPMLWGPTAYPSGIAGSLRTDPLRPGPTSEQLSEQGNGDPHLRSCKEVSGYHIEASDGDLGHIDDYLFDDESWSIRYVVIETRNWLPGKRVLIASDWVERVSWNEHKAYVDLSREAIREAPEYDRDLILTEGEESDLHRHYQRRFDKPQGEHRR